MCPLPAAGADVPIGPGTAPGPPSSVICSANAAFLQRGSHSPRHSEPKAKNPLAPSKRELLAKLSEGAFHPGTGWEKRMLRFAQHDAVLSRRGRCPHRPGHSPGPTLIRRLNAATFPLEGGRHSPRHSEPKAKNPLAPSKRELSAKLTEGAFHPGTGWEKRMLRLAQHDAVLSRRGRCPHRPGHSPRPTLIRRLNAATFPLEGGRSGVWKPSPHRGEGGWPKARRMRGRSEAGLARLSAARPMRYRPRLPFVRRKNIFPI